MTNTRIYFDGKRVGPIFRRATEKRGEKVRSAVRGAAQDAADEIVRRGKIDIASAGKFGTRWTQGLHATVSEGGGNVKIDITHDVPYFRIFEYGGVIYGKPLLWIPLSFADVPKGLWARDYPEPLFKVVRKSDGLPLLGVKGATDGNVFKYFGKESVLEPKKFHIREIARDVAKGLNKFYNVRLKEGVKVEKNESSSSDSGSGSSNSPSNSVDAGTGGGGGSGGFGGGSTKAKKKKKRRR